MYLCNTETVLQKIVVDTINTLKTDNIPDVKQPIIKRYETDLKDLNKSHACDTYWSK